MIRVGLTANGMSVCLTEEHYELAQKLKRVKFHLSQTEAGIELSLISSVNGGLGTDQKSVKVPSWFYLCSNSHVYGMTLLQEKKNLQPTDFFGLTEITTYSCNESNTKLTMLLPDKEFRRASRSTQKMKSLLPQQKRVTPKSPLEDLVWKKSSIISTALPSPESDSVPVRETATTISLREAVDAVNAHKDRAGKELVLNITEDGTLESLVRYGR